MHNVSRRWYEVVTDSVPRENEIPGDWRELVDAIHRRKGSALILGTSDTGKSTLAHFLLVHLSRKGNVVAFIDGDIGQSVLGPPTTIGLARFDSPPKQLEMVQPLTSYFVGSNSPRGHMLEMLVGMKRISERAAELEPEIIIIDTTGFVSGEAAWELKFQKVDLLRPTHLIGLQRQRELENLLRVHQLRTDMDIHRLKVHEKVTTKSPEQRRSNRSRKFADYFREVKLYERSLDGMKVVSPFKVRHGIKGLNGVLIGLNDEANFNLGLGIVETLDVHRGTISFLAPDLDLSRMRFIRIGSLEVDLFGDDKIQYH
jgi:polynucleotide 5'-hydroxyl-kinase GRC3/NOL9